MKKVLTITGVVIVFFIILLMVGVSNVGPLIKKAVNTAGPYITKTAVTLEDVSVSIFSGEATVEGFTLGNPDGFNSPVAMKVGTVSVDLDEESVTDNPIIIHKIEIIQPDITYEKKRGTDNFEVILSNIAKAVQSEQGGKRTAAKKAGQKPAKTLLINHVIVKDGTVNLVVDFMGGGAVSASLPDIHLTGIGKGKKGVTPAEAFEIIFESIYSGISAESVTGVLTNGLNRLGDLKNIHDEGGDAAGKALETVTSTLESAADGLSDFFNSE